jgi:hypothetical protein
VGASGPKLSVDDLLAELEDIVKDAIVGGATEDHYLGYLLNMVVASIADGRPLFSSPLDEPAFYRRFRRWVIGGLDELSRLSQDPNKE